MKNNNTLSPCIRVLMKSFPLIIWWYMHSSYVFWFSLVFWTQSFVFLSLFIFVIVIVIFLGQSVEGKRYSQVKPMWRQAIIWGTPRTNCMLGCHTQIISKVVLAMVAPHFGIVFLEATYTESLGSFKREISKALWGTAFTESSFLIRARN